MVDGTRSETSVFKFGLRINSDPRLKYKQSLFRKITEVKEVSSGKSKSAGLHGPRKQLTKAKQWP